MDALKQKFNSRRGASILLALLFLLICMLGAASVLMAAASNAGKIKSNKMEQQKYLTLASALNLLCDELENVKYVGQYDYVQEPCEEYIYVTTDADGDSTETVVTGSVGADGGTIYTDGDGNVVSGGTILTDGDGNAITLHDQHRTYTQIPGLLTRNNGSTTWLDTVLPLRNDFDYIFAIQFYVPDGKQIDGDLYKFISLLNSENPETDPLATPKDSYTMTFAVPLDESLSDEEKEELKKLYGDFLKTVRIIVKMWDDGRIELTATLMEGDDPANLEPTKYIMTAVLKPENENWRQKLLVLSNHNGSQSGCTTKPVKWVREYIAKGEEAEPGEEDEP